jgi:hypothetical protein
MHSIDGEQLMSKASWIHSILYDYRLDGLAIREQNLEIDD